jgi:hypothetical protein
MNSNLTPYQLDEIAWKHLSTLPYFRGCCARLSTACMPVWNCAPDSGYWRGGR